ncbi:MAG: hypothetical protein II988_04175 [Clostridia bacterium]|nr:hypothetical protein [Clostridia bacterium]MBQ3493598.1 hypothetical protein [Clostridia bacterium]MBQ3596995.1 hypothetical protein [Clostridia bacterium]
MKIKKELKIITKGKIDVFKLSETEQNLFFNSLLTNILEIFNKTEKGD